MHLYKIFFIKVFKYIYIQRNLSTVPSLVIPSDAVTQFRNFVQLQWRQTYS